MNVGNAVAAASGSFLAEISVGSPNEYYLLSFCKKIFSGSKYPKNMIFNIEKEALAAALVQ